LLRRCFGGGAGAGAASAGDMAATQGEVQELRELFASPPRQASPPRESALPLTRIAKFGVADENRRLAEQGRMEKEERLRLREQEAAERLNKAHESKANALATNERAKLHKDMTRQMNQTLVRSIRETEAEWQNERHLAFNNFRDEARKKVLIANALDARLDAQEEAVDAEERRIATRDRKELMREVEEVRQANLLAKRENATNVRETTTKAVAQALDETAIKKRLAAEAKRNDSRQWAREKAVNGYELVVRAKAGKKAAELTQRKLKESKDLMTNERKAFVMRDKKERMIDYTVAQDKAKQLQNNRDSVEKRYRSKFANSDEAMQWETAPLRRWYG